MNYHTNQQNKRSPLKFQKMSSVTPLKIQSDFSPLIKPNPSSIKESQDKTLCSYSLSGYNTASAKTL